MSQPTKIKTPRTANLSSLHDLMYRVTSHINHFLIRMDTANQNSHMRSERKTPIFTLLPFCMVHPASSFILDSGLLGHRFRSGHSQVFGYFESSCILRTRENTWSDFCSANSFCEIISSRNERKST